MKKKSVLIILGILLGLNIFAWIAVWELAGSEGLEVTFFDVGQGDAIFIELPNRQQILIDGGPDGQLLLDKLGKEMPFWDRTIDLVILSHPEQDHLAGLIDVLKSYKVKNILWTGVVRDTPEYREWEKLIQEESADIYIVKAGQVVSGEEAPANGPRPLLRILYPFGSLEGKEVKDSNNTSIIAKLVFGETSFLFTGDATQSVEKELVFDSAGPELDSDVLKAGHHGSKTSSSKEFIGAVSPEIAVIQCGKDNSYGHPHQEVLDNLAAVNILRTDLGGDIKIFSDGIKISEVGSR